MRSLSVAYIAGQPILEDLNLRVNAGERVALLGASGCGKTTLLRTIAGLERPSLGSITIGGTTVVDAGSRGKTVPPEDRNVGMVFQDGGLFPHLTVAENVAFGLRSGAVRTSLLGRPSPANNETVNKMLRLVDLEGFGERLPGTLSGGQQQRVALARALAPQPKVLLLDEPFSALDSSLRVQVRSEVAHILREIGVTVVFVTHDQDEAFVLGDRVAVMERGHITQIGSPDELYRSPASLAVGAFVGEANIVPALIQGDRAETILGRIPLLHPADPGASTTDQSGEAAKLGHVLIRPEALRMVAGEDSMIEHVEYYGHDTRYDLRLGDGSILIVRDAHDIPRQVGERVGVKFIGEPVMAWADPGDSPRV